MPGYKANLAEEERARPSALERQTTKMPDALRGDKWAFVELLVRASPVVCSCFPCMILWPV